MRRAFVADALVGLGAAVAAVTALVLSASLPVLPADPAGLAIWPRTLSIVILIGVAIILLDGIRRRRAAAHAPPATNVTGQAESRQLVRVGDPMARVWLSGALFVAYAGLVSVAGFLLPSFLLVAVLMLLFGARLAETLAYAAALACGLNLLFFQVLGATPPARDWLIALLPAWR